MRTIRAATTGPFVSPAARCSIRENNCGGRKPRPRIYGAYRQHQRMIRKGSHKLILYPEAKVARVFDLAKDPHEMNDLAGTAGG